VAGELAALAEKVRSFTAGARAERGV